MISEGDAVERAKQWLADSGTAFAGREVIVSLDQRGVYTVVFPPPPDTLGGDFTLRVNAQTGEVLDAVIER